ncbi:MAG: hypothetical protein Q4B70_01070 [Lachnospiraceae bacterium]|nr:hypothetical protein [Lachnospiraceae bacterium]
MNNVGGMKMAEVGRYDAGLRQELCAYYRWGLSVMIDEKTYKTQDINQMCRVLEGSNYMRDFVEDPSGKISSVNFTRLPTGKRRKS